MSSLHGALSTTRAVVDNAPTNEAGLVPGGLPVFSGRNPSDVGSIAHWLVGTHVSLVTNRSESDAHVSPGLLAALHACATSMVSDASTPNRRRVVATEAAGFAYRYLVGLVPAWPWRFIDVEYDTGDGLVDMAWQHRRTGQVFFDELKTTRLPGGRVPQNWLAQARRYATAGRARFGDAFLGTRLVPLHALATVWLVQPVTAPARLAPTLAEPVRASAVSPVNPPGRSATPRTASSYPSQFRPLVLKEVNRP